MNMQPTGRRVWRVLRWPLLILILLYVALVIYRAFDLIGIDETKQAVADIHAQKITMDDVLGSNKPPAPKVSVMQASLEGVDANKNGIRDEIELMILRKYPTNKQERAAAMQYAHAFQTYLIKVGNSETWIAATQEMDRALGCMYEVTQYDIPWVKSFLKGMQESMVDTPRRQAKDQKNESYRVSYPILSGEDCDIRI